MNYEQHPVYKHFETISRIPHGSGNEKALSDYILRFARNLGLDAVQDEMNSLVIHKPATAGYENAPVVMIQGHLDMVCEKNRDTVHDFARDPLRLIVEGDWLRADGTTLGADDGVAIAMALTLMEDTTLAHPALEFVLTADEEVGLVGATALDAALLSGDVLINLDSGEEGVFLTSCAGGRKLDMFLPLAEEPAPAGYACAAIRVSGLMGGHSGIDINRGRGNAIKLLTQLLEALTQTTDVHLAYISGGAKDNAIPREAEAVVLVPGDAREALFANVSAANEKARAAYTASDPLVTIAVLAAETPGAVIDKPSAKRLLDVLTAIPSGVLAFSQAFPDLVETSNNLGVVQTEHGAAHIVCALRSSVTAQKQALEASLRALAETAGAAVEIHGDYPGWAHNPESKIRRLFVETYEETTGKKATLLAVHAGLECGLLAEKRPGLDMIALGPDMYDIHSPIERLSISSLLRTWDLLVTVLARMGDM